jgi:hypothetical protein
MYRFAKITYRYVIFVHIHIRKNQSLQTSEYQYPSFNNFGLHAAWEQKGRLNLIRFSHSDVSTHSNAPVIHDIRKLADSFTSCFFGYVYWSLLSDLPVDNNKKIWKMKIPLKIKIFGWYLRRGVILTKNNLVKRNWHVQLGTSTPASLYFIIIKLDARLLP